MNPDISSGGAATRQAVTGLAAAVAVLALAGALAGCRARPPAPAPRPAYASDGDVRAQRLEVPDEQRYQPGAGMTYISPVSMNDNAVPQYPEKLLSRQLPPVSVTVRVIVDARGAVTAAAVTASDSAQPEFDAAVLAAVRSWRFQPLQRMQQGVVEALPFTQHYRFVFTQVNGRAVVTPAAAAAD